VEKKRFSPILSGFFNREAGKAIKIAFLHAFPFQNGSPGQVWQVL
jgi:hypothetical protein